jgi:hypothetical protein
MVSLIARRAGGADYRGRLRFASAGTTFLAAAHAVGETETFMGTEVNAHVAYAAGSSVAADASAGRQPDDRPHARVGRRVSGALDVGLHGH